MQQPLPEEPARTASVSQINADLIRREIASASPNLDDLRQLLEERDTHLFQLDEAVASACEHDHPEVLQLLVDMKILGIDGLEQAARRILLFYPVELYDVCLKNGVKIDRPNVSGFYPIHLAVHSNDPAKLEYLVKHGANLESRLPPGRTRALDTDGMTPLQLAVAYAQPDSVRSLMKLGANVRAKTASGRDLLTLSGDFSKVLLERMKNRNRSQQDIDEFSKQIDEVRLILKGAGPVSH